MKRMAGLLLLLLTGCSTAPCADLMDACNPGKIEAGPANGGAGNAPANQPSTPPVTSFAAAPVNPALTTPAVAPVRSVARTAPTAETAPVPAMAPATGSWKRMVQ